MRKRLTAMLMACVLLAGCGSGGQKDPEPAPPENPAPNTQQQEQLPAVGETQDPEGEELKQLREQMEKNGDLLAVAYLGYAELPYFMDVGVYLEANGFGERYPFLNEIPEERLVRQEGGELYAVVPADADTTLTVYGYVMDDKDYMPDVGEKLFEVTDGKPLFLIGNVSEIVPNLCIFAENSKGKVEEYTPCVSIMDGSLYTVEGVYDFTPMDLVMQAVPGFDPVPDAIYSGTWYTQHLDGNGKRMAMTLTLSPDGWAEYFYGEVNSDILEWFEGSWTSNEADQIVLDLHGGPVVTEGSESEGEQYDLHLTCEWDFYGRSFMMHSVDGAELLYGTAGQEYVFLPFNGYYLVGDWIAEEPSRGWTYELLLYMNGECGFNIYHSDGEMAGYEGWWSVENDVLEFSAQLYTGEHPETPEMDYISGSYLTQLSSTREMTVQFLEGSILTLDMEESTVEEFTRRG